MPQLLHLLERAREGFGELLVLLRGGKINEGRRIPKAGVQRRTSQPGKASCARERGGGTLTRTCAISNMSFSLEISFFFISATSSLSERIKSRLLCVMSLSASGGQRSAIGAVGRVC